MPQASNKLQDTMIQRFGSIDCVEPLKFLLDRGYTERAGYITLPNPLHKITSEEGDCIDFLCDEWDFAYSVTLA